LVRFAPKKLVPDKLVMWPGVVKLAFVRSAPSKTAPCRFAPVKMAPTRFWPAKLWFCRFWPEKSIPVPDGAGGGGEVGSGDGSPTAPVVLAPAKSVVLVISALVKIEF